MRRVIIVPPTADQSHPTELRCENRLWAVVETTLLEETGPMGPLDAPRRVVRSGNPVTDAESAFASWSGAAWKRFDEAAQRLLDSGGPTPVVWPGSGSVLSDAVSTLSFARRQPAIGLLLDPVAWISDSMAKDAQDHLARFAGALTLCDTVEGVVVRPCVPADLDAAAVAQALRPLLDRVGTVVATLDDLAAI